MASNESEKAKNSIARQGQETEIGVANESLVDNSFTKGKRADFSFGRSSKWE